MIELKSDMDPIRESSLNTIPLAFHPSVNAVYEKLKKWLARFPFSVDNSVYHDLTLLYLLATKKYLDHRNPAHLFRVVLSMHLLQKKLLRLATYSPLLRHVEIRWTPTYLRFPFAHKPVLGCVVGFNLMDRYEVFDEENVILALQKYLPLLRLVKESTYCHTSQHKNLKMFYFEIEKKDGLPFSLLEQKLLILSLQQKVRKSIQPLSPTIFMGLNDEEMYKNILVLGQEIHNLDDLPQAYITLDQQTGKEIIFRISLVHISPFHRFSLKDRFFGASYELQRTLTVRHLDTHPIHAHIFRLHLPRDASLLRSDGSLDFYLARKKVVTLMNAAIGEFRDYNGGILIKQQELLHGFKENFLHIFESDPELLESFFYAILPLEKQVVLPKNTLSTLFSYFLDNCKEKLPTDSFYSFNVHRSDQHFFLVVRGKDTSLTGIISSVLQESIYKHIDMAYNFVDAMGGVFFNCILMQPNQQDVESLIQSLQDSIHKWHQKMKNRQVLRIGLEFSIMSLDPRIGGDAASGNIIRLLFEGLTRSTPNGDIENAIAESIETSLDMREYTFKLRSSLWNDGSSVTAYDFEYAWKKVLSPDFKTAFAYLFYPIKNAREAKEGKVPPEQIGIYAIDDRTLKVHLVRPTPYFLQSTALPLYSPVHRIIDQQHPQWPYECEKNYPCNGAFQLKFNQPNQGYQLVRNPYYWDAYNITLDQITLTQMTPVQASQAFKKNEIDWAGNPFGGWHSFYVPRENDNVLSIPNSWVCWWVFNTTCAPFQNLKMRQAFAYAVQRVQIVSGAFLPINPAYSPLLPRHRESNSQSLFPDYNPELARQLFQEALKELAVSKADLPPFTIMFHEQGIREYTARCLKQQFKECFDIECELMPLSWNAYFHKMIKGGFHLGIVHWESWVDDPIYTLNHFKTAKQELNFSKWQNAEFQKHLHLFEEEVNPFQRSLHLQKAEVILSQEMPIVPLFYQPYQALVKKDLHVNYPISGGGLNISRSFYKKKETFHYVTNDTRI